MSKLTRERTERILEAARLGATYATAAKCGGISRKTLWEWLRKGNAEWEDQEEAEEMAEEAREAGKPFEPVPPLGELGLFAQAWAAAGSQAQKAAIKAVREAARDPRNWKAAARLLAWRWPERWGTPAQQKRIEEHWKKHLSKERPPAGPEVKLIHIGLEEIDPDDPLLQQVFTSTDYWRLTTGD